MTFVIKTVNFQIVRLFQVLSKIWNRGILWSVKRAWFKTNESLEDLFDQLSSLARDVWRYKNFRQPWTNLQTELRFRYLNQKSYNYGGQSKKSPSGPLHCHIEVTSRCNLTCPMCPRNDIDNRDNGFMSLKTFKKVLSKLREKGLPESLFLHFSGEPTLNPELTEIIEHAKSQGVAWIKFNTNITLIDDEMALKLLKSGLDCIVLAMEISEEDQLKLRPGSDYQDVKRKSIRFMELKRKTKALKPLVKLQMLISKDNMPLKQGAYQEWKHVVDRVDFHPLHTVGGTVDDYGATKLKRDHCEQLWTTMVFLWNGDAVPCCYDHGGKLKIGNILNQSLNELWNSPFLEGLRKDDKLGVYTNPVCNTCMKMGLDY